METAERLAFGKQTQSFTLAPFFVIGVIVWLGATLAMRVAGQFFFHHDSAAWMAVNFTAMLIAMPLLAYAIFQWRRVPVTQRAAAAVAVAVPGMLLDVLTTYFFAQTFPNVNAAGDGAWGAWLLFSYALFLVPVLWGGKDE
jgi:hypothetical protein